MSLHDGPAAGSRRTAVHERRDTVDAALETRLRALGPALDGEPDPAFRTATRARLVAMAAVRTPAPAPVTGWRRLLSLRADAPARPRRRTRLTAGLAGAALTVTVLATLVAVSTGARPGDVLYGLKRGTEQTQLALAGDSRGQTLLQFASTRLSELNGLREDGDAALAVTTLHTMDRQTTEAASWLTTRAVTTRSSAPVDELAGWTDGQRSGLAALQPRLPTAARPAAAHSLALLARVGARADAVTAALSCPAGPATKGRDALGPLPAPCAAPSPGAGGNGGSGAGQASIPPVGSAPGDAGTTGANAGPGGGSGSAATTASPTVPGTGSVGGSTGAIVPTTPPLVNLPLPTLPLPLPGSSATGPAGSGGSSAPGSSAPPAPVSGICLPPLVTLGNC